MVKLKTIKPTLIIQAVALLLSTSSFAQKNGQLDVVIDANNKAQKIDNIGGSAAWFSENIGKF